MAGVARGIGKALESTVKSIVRDPVSIVPAAIGVMTGNPLIAAASSGGLSAARGNNLNGVLRSAVTGGFGAYAGNEIGGYAGKALAGSGSTRQILGSALGRQIGTGAGAFALQQRQQPSQFFGSSSVPEAIPTVPSFEEMRNNAIFETRKAFSRYNVFDRIVPGKYVSALRRGSLPRYGMRMWKDLIKRKTGDFR
jgi:hypothetical protein